MWSKISSVLRPRGAHGDHDPSPSSLNQPDVMSRVYEQHPNLSVFHDPSGRVASPSPPPSPSKSIKRNMFKRLSRAPFKDDNESVRAPSPMVGQSKKVRSPLNLVNGNHSQASLSKLPVDKQQSVPMRRSSLDMLRSANEAANRQNATFSTGSPRQRPSLDVLRSNKQETYITGEPSPLTPSADAKFGSVRSILRDPKTPGTGQNVRFFSRDAYKVISPDQSMDVDTQPMVLQPEPSNSINQFGPSASAPSVPAITRASGSTKAARPSVAEVFSPLSSTDAPPPAKDQAQFHNSTNFLEPIPPPNFTDFFDVSQNLDLPKVPPGLGFEVAEPTNIDMSMTEDDYANEDAADNVMTSTPFKDKGKGKAADVPSDVTPEKEAVPPPPPPPHNEIDETIFHSREKSPRLPPILHDRSQSFSFGQTVFHSIAENDPSSAKSTPDSSFAFSSGDLKPSLLQRGELASPASASAPKHLKNRNRALSDTVFQSMMRSSPKPPEADINDESSQDLVVYSAAPEQPDPFRANATTYYTPQTMIPTTPPQGAPANHTRKASKEENIIYSLQTQLALQTELCSQYESDLRARDELVGILENRLSDFEKEDVKRRSILRTWKKKVQELEKTCRYLEEEVEGSRQNSMERSVMDEASGEALRMLHKQIAVLEREKTEWARKEEGLREEVGTLEALVKDRSEDVMQLKENLWKRDESERELEEGIRQAKEQIEQMGNISCGLIDEEELKKLVMEKDLRSEQERERHRVAEFGWDEEKQEILSNVQHLTTEKTTLEAELENAKLQLKTRDEEHDVLKAELEAQWSSTEKTTEKMDSLQAKVDDLEKERDALKGDIEQLEQKVSEMETEWNESENRRMELETELQEMWTYKEELEKEREQFEDQLQRERDHSEGLKRALQQCETRISELDQERQFSMDTISRLEEKIRQRDEEVTETSQRTKQREDEAEQLREEMTNLRREHSRIVDEQTRELQEVTLRDSEARARMASMVRQHATVEMETKSSNEKIGALKDEVERLRRRIQVLQQESADKEVKLVQLSKQHQRDKDDLEGMNTALDSKQMELELIKRNLGVRGTGGTTPAPASRVAHQRRDSTVPSTPVSRPSSVISDTGSIVSKDRKRTSAETPMSATPKLAVLGKSSRVNGATATASAAKRIEGSMGPPPLKPRPSMTSASTPTPAARGASFSRSSSAKVIAQPTSVTPHRRVSSAEQTQGKLKYLRQGVSESPVGSVSEVEEKENLDVGTKRRSLIPTPA